MAVDAESQAIDILKDRLPAGAPVELIRSTFQHFTVPPCDVVVAGFSLFFLDAQEFAEFWPRIVAALRPGGLFAGQFLGVNDEWVARGYSAHTTEQVHALLEDFDELYFEEVERDGETAQRTPKHWHVFHVVARKLS